MKGADAASELLTHLECPWWHTWQPCKALHSNISLISAFGGKAVILFNDGAVKSLPITPAGRSTDRLVTSPLEAATAIFTTGNPSLSAASYDFACL